MVGKTVSHYKILERLGGGGMGVVYKAQDLRLDRPVALKFLPPELTRDTKAKQRFIREAKAASALDHDNICTIHEIDESAEGRMFIAMACYEGETLTKKIERGPLGIDESIGIVRQISQGLAKAHEKGIIHRDIKPANVIITREGGAKIVDFGLAKLTGRTLLTKSGSTMGTAAYMSPEQAQGGTVDARSDLFSLGVVFYEMVTGRRPFLAEHEAALMYSIVNVDPPAPSTINHRIPPALETIILRLLAKSPNDRYQKASELSSDLLNLISHTSPRGKLFAHIRKSLSKRTSVYVGAAIVLVCIGLLVSQRMFSPVPKKTAWRIAVLPFARITQRSETGDWPMVVQMMMVTQLSGTEEMRIIAPNVFSELAGRASAGEPQTIVSAKQRDASFLVQGTFETLDTTYIIRCTLTDVSDGSVKMSDAEPFATERDLPHAVQNISEQILNFFQIQTLSGDGRNKEDIQPWLIHRTNKLDAVKAFLQGARVRWQMQPGGEKFFRKAIELDSLYITPRTWLISGLVLNGEFAEAREHQAFLLRHIFNAGPFEQALIRWTGAMIDGKAAAQAEALEEALEYSPGNDVLIYLLADIKYSQGDYGGAAQTIRLSVESGWTFQPASFILGTSLFQLHQFSQSRTILEHSLKLETLLPATYAFLAALALRDGDANASEEYEREFILRAQGEGATLDSVYGLLADNFAFLGLHKAAAEYYSKATDINQGNAGYYLGLARSTVELGDISQAARAARHAWSLDSTSFQVHDLLGRVFDIKGDTSHALQHYLTCLVKDSANPRSGEIRKRVDELMRK